jgi:hypothetical protein
MKNYLENILMTSIFLFGNAYFLIAVAEKSDWRYAIYTWVFTWLTSATIGGLIYLFIIKMEKKRGAKSQ